MKLEVKRPSGRLCLPVQRRAGRFGKLAGRWAASHPPPLTAPAGTRECQACWQKHLKRPTRGGRGKSFLLSLPETLSRYLVIP